MRIALRVALIALLLGLGVWGWMALHPAPEKVIRKILNEAAQCVAFKSDQGDLSRLASAQKLGDYFTADARVLIDAPDGGKHVLEGREEIKEAAALAGRFIRNAKIELVGFNILLTSGKTAAEVEFTARFTLPDDDLNVQELKALMKLTNGDWLIERVETVKVLQ